MEEGPNPSGHVFIFQLQNTASLLQTLCLGLSGKVNEQVKEVDC